MKNRKKELQHFFLHYY